MSVEGTTGGRERGWPPDPSSAASGSSARSGRAAWESSTSRAELRLERLVALKVIRSELARDDDFRARFRSESRTAASIDTRGW